MKSHATIIVGRLFAVVGLALIAPVARAQFAASFQTNTISAVTSNWVGNGTYVVGSNTSFDALIIQSGGVLSNGTGYIGYESFATNNAAIVRDAGSAWTNRFDLYVGYKGAGNRLVISNGGTVYSTNAVVGMFASASNNTVIVSGSNSVWSIASGLTISSNAPNNTLIITNGGRVVDGGALIGTDVGGSPSATVLVTGTNSFWNNSTNALVSTDFGMGITVANGGRFAAGGTVQIGRSAGSSGNIVLVTDPGSTWSNGTLLQVSGFSGFNQFIVSNGASASSGSATIGPNLSTLSNSVVVTDPGSVWTVAGSITVADSGTGSVLTVNNGGRVRAQDEFVGNQTGSSGALLVAGGTNEVFNSLQLGQFGGAGTVTIATGGLFVTNALASATTVINSNCILILGPGTFKSDNLVVTNGGTVRYNLTYQLDNGTVTVAGGSLQAGSNLNIAATASSTGIVLVVGGTLVATNGVFGIGNNGTITGTGGVGRLTVSNGTLLATTIFLGSSTSNQSDLIVGSGGTISCSAGSNCLMVINSLGADNFGIVDLPDGTKEVGVTQPADYNIEAGAMDNFGDVYVGYSDTGTMTIAGGVANISSRLIVGHIGSPVVANGTVWITGGQVTVNSDTFIGNDGVGQATISGSAVMTATKVTVANSGNPGTLTVAGGTLNVYDGLTIGDCNAGHVGAVTITSGNLFITNAAHTATLDVRNGTMTLNGGLLRVDRLVMTNTCGLFVHNGGNIFHAGSISLLLDPNLDADGDGMPNGWEQNRGFDPLNAADAQADADGDGVSNLREYQLGTDPHNAFDPFRITAITRELNNVRITWTTVGGNTNVVQTTPGMVGGSYSNNFADLNPQLIISGTTVTSTNYLDVNGATNVPARYYRIRLVP